MLRVCGRFCKRDLERPGGRGEPKKLILWCAMDLQTCFGVGFAGTGDLGAGEPHAAAPRLERGSWPKWTGFGFH